MASTLAAGLAWNIFEKRFSTGNAVIRDLVTGGTTEVTAEDATTE
jgi:hypothetical protein